MLEKEIMKNSKVDFTKLEEYGFKKENDTYQYETTFLENQFKVIIKIDKNGVLTSQIIDQELGEEYLNINTNTSGEFVNTLRTSYQEILEDIKKNCFQTNSFSSPQANRITQYIETKYHTRVEFLWDTSPDAGVFRAPNKKWYGIIMQIERSKISTGNDIVDIINIKLSKEEISNLIKKEGYYKAYHMNKTSWITITLDDTLSDKEIEEQIDKSYQNIMISNEWLVPANPKYYDIIHAFDKTNQIDWKQSSNIQIGDIIYLYVTEPYKKIFYRCKAIEVDIPYSYQDKNLTINRTMKIQLLENVSSKNYTFEYLKANGIKMIRGPRKLPKNILE